MKEEQLVQNTGLLVTVFIHTNAPSLIIAPPPPPLYLCKAHFSGFYIPFNSQHLCDSEKKMHFSTSLIKYLLQEIKKIGAKHGSFDHRRIEIYKNTK